MSESSKPHKRYSTKAQRKLGFFVVGDYFYSPSACHSLVIIRAEQEFVQIDCNSQVNWHWNCINHVIN